MRQTGSTACCVWPLTDEVELDRLRDVAQSRHAQSVGLPPDERGLLDAESVAGHLVDRGRFFGLLAEHRRVLFPMRLFADLFPSVRPRPSVPVDIVASVVVLLSLRGLSDRESMAAVRTDLRWKVACGLPIGHGGFDPSTLTHWRKRLAASASPLRILDAVKAVVA
jgi:hypothetical protein